MGKSLLSSFGSEENRWLTTQRFKQYALIASGEYWTLLLLLLAYSNNKHPNKQGKDNTEKHT